MIELVETWGRIRRADRRYASVIAYGIKGLWAVESEPGWDDVID